MSAFGVSVRQTLRLGGADRTLWIPFLLPLLLQLVFLGLLWLAPHPPFSALLAPPIRYVVGERVLHYPWHLWFLYDALKHIAVAGSVLLGAWMSGLACAMVAQAHDGQRLSLRGALLHGHVRYATVSLIWVVSWGLAAGALGAVAQRIGPAAWRAGSVIAVAVALQALLVFAIPAAVFDRLSWWKALWRGAGEAVAHPLSTVAIVAVPTAMMLAFAFAAPPARVAAWMMAATPELVLGVIVARLVVGTIADAILTVAAAHLWWNHRAAAVPLERIAAVTEGPVVA